MVPLPHFVGEDAIRSRSRGRTPPASDVKQRILFASPLLMTGIGEPSKGGVATPGGPGPYYLIAILHFDYRGAIQKAFGSAEGEAAVADVQTFAAGGADIFMFENADA
jgi:hypothetical protein